MQRRIRNRDKHQDEITQAIIQESKDKNRKDIRKKDNDKITIEIKVSITNGTDKI